MRTDSIRLTRENPSIALKSQCNWNGSGGGEQWIDLIICEMQCLHVKRKTAAAISNRDTVLKHSQSHCIRVTERGKFDASGLSTALSRPSKPVRLFIQWNTKGGIVAVLKCCNCDQTPSQDKSPNKVCMTSETVLYSSASPFKDAQIPTSALNWVFSGVSLFWDDGLNVFVYTVWVVTTIWGAFQNLKPSYKKL